MKSYFDLAALRESIQDFYRLSGIRISVFDNAFHEISSYPVQRSLFCETMRKNPRFEKACKACDRAHILEASQRQEALIYTCHAGLQEIIVPLQGGPAGEIGYLFFSHILRYSSADEAWSKISQAIASYASDKTAAELAIRAMPLYDESYLKAAALVLQAAASYLCSKRLAYFQQETLSDRIEHYLQNHLDEDLSIDRLSQEFSLSRATLYEAMKTLAPEGIAKHIRALRLNAAMVLLEEESESKISDIAERVGFNDYSHFIVAFRQAKGITPKKYQELLRHS